MSKLTTSEARQAFSELINRAAFGKERVILTRRGRKLVAVIPVEDLEALEQLEDVVDVLRTERALANPKNRRRVSWDKVKKELGL